MIRIEVGNISLRIFDQAFMKMLDFRQIENHKPESGGILIGYYIDNFSYVVTDITIPTCFDKFSRFNFIRSRISAQKAINILFKESGGKKIYLGEWHSHPEKLPTPSFLDCKSIKKQLQKNKLNSDLIFMFIIGNEGISISFVSNEGISNQNLIPYSQITNKQTSSDLTIK